MDIYAVDHFEEIQVGFAGMDEAAPGQLSPWQRRMTIGDHFVSFAEGHDERWGVYGVIVEDLPEAKGTMVVARIYTAPVRRRAVNGELGTIYRSGFHAPLTREQFVRCQHAGWPRTRLELLPVLYGPTPVFAVFQEVSRRKFLPLMRITSAITSAITSGSISSARAVGLGNRLHAILRNGRLEWGTAAQLAQDGVFVADWFVAQQAGNGSQLYWHEELDGH